MENAVQLQNFWRNDFEEGFDPSALPKSCQTPMMLHFIRVKAQQPQALLFYRMGDFFELFFEDAVTAAKALDLTLTTRNRNSDEPIPMCGVPHHAAQNYIQKLTDLGFRVAICDQLEDPKQAKGIVKRDITRVVTPSMVLDPMTAAKEEDFFVDCIYYSSKSKKQQAWVYLRYATTSGKTSFLEAPSLEDVVDFLLKRPAQEILVSDEDYVTVVDFLSQHAQSLVAKLFRMRFQRADLEETKRRSMKVLNVQSLEPFGIEHLDLKFLTPLSSLFQYLSDTQKNSTWDHLRVEPFEEAMTMAVDTQTYEHLEVFHSQDQANKDATLTACFDAITTGLGKRRLIKKLLQPHRGKETIERAQELAKWFATHNTEGFQKKMEATWDLERLAHKAVLGTLNPVNVTQIKQTIEKAQELTEIYNDQTHIKLKPNVEPLLELAEEIKKTVQETPPIEVGKGKVITKGIDEVLDQHRDILENSQAWLSNYESQQRDLTKIANLKVKFNKVFGFTIEISKSHVAKALPSYQRKQTLANGERFITEELVEFEQKWQAASEVIATREQVIFQELTNKINKQVTKLQTLARIIGELDCAFGAAEKVRNNNYCFPQMTTQKEIQLTDCRHPVLERIQKEAFIPNTVSFQNQNEFILLTGPNMSGKSTLMRQVGLCALLAHAGLPAPAKTARLGVMDKIFTRVGASDRLARGQSTFMVEMVETATILRKATEHSLVLIDEIGRGTSTFDGMSIAWAVAEALVQETKCLTYFATHYHELVALEDQHPGVRCGEMAIQEWKGQIVFLRKFQWGACQKSYGINVARLAGMPKSVLKRAEKKLEEYASQKQTSQMRLI